MKQTKKYPINRNYHNQRPTNNQFRQRQQQFDKD